MPEARPRTVSLITAAAVAALAMAVRSPWVVLAAGAAALALATSALAQAPLLRALRSRLLVWGCAVAASAVAAWGPARWLEVGGGLPAAWLLGALAAVATLLAWGCWSALVSRGTDLAAALRAAARAPDRWAWQGLPVALGVTLALAFILLLAWPGMLNGAVRAGLAFVAGVWIVACPWWMRGWRAFAPVRAPVAIAARNVEVVSLQALGEQAVLVDALEPAAVAAWPERPDARVCTSPDGAIAGPAADAALYEAARSGQVERALSLLDSGANALALPPPGQRDQRPLVVLAAVLPDLRLLRALIARGAVLDASDATSPLLAATRDSWHGRPDAVTMLLANGADVTARDGEGNQPLHHAARSTDPAVAALLLDAGAAVDAPNAAGLTPLSMACASGNWRLARFLLEHGASVAPHGCEPPLVSAASTDDDDPAGVQLLLRSRAPVDAPDAAGRTALHRAALAGYPAIAQTLLDAGATPDAPDHEGRSPLMLASRGGHVSVQDALLEHAASSALLDHDGHDALWHAIDGPAGAAESVERLLAAGAPRGAIHHGEPVCTFARRRGRWAIAALLDPQAHAAWDASETRPPYAVVSEALLAGDQALLARHAALLERADYSRMLGELAALHPHVIPWLLAQGADPEVRRTAHSLPVELLIDGPGHPTALQALDVLIEHGASLAGRGVLAEWLRACRASKPPPADGERRALGWLASGADAFGRDAEGTPPLHHAIALGWPRLWNALLGLGADPNALGTAGTTPLHAAVEAAQLAAVQALVRAGSRIETRAADGQTALGLALATPAGRPFADWLEWRGWQPPGRPLRPADLPDAARMGDANAVRRLLALGLAVDAVDDQGCTALLRAAGGGHADVVELLLAAGADAARAATTGATPLSAAVSMRHVKVVEYLLAGGADITQTLPGGVDSLMLACALGLPEMASLLIRAGAPVSATDLRGLGPMHCAALYGFSSRDRTRLVTLLDTLLLAGADPASRANDGSTPLLLLCGGRAESRSGCDEATLVAGCERLLDEEVDLTAHDERGFTALHAAAQHGLPALVRLLRAAGAPLDARDRLNRLPRDIALMHGFVDVAGELSEGPPQTVASTAVSMARLLRPGPDTLS